MDITQHDLTCLALMSEKKVNNLINVDLHNVSLSNKQHHNLYCRYVYAFKIDTIQQHLF